ncbi:transglycosylase SLT domain-containing protein [Neptunicella marina]|uniref:Transglycosylase SLT domain-containing protein n=1 Tax=Neptunicella marina TaxID=2125989 RepID=A0A8J6LZE5_9ALTE|nr:transglycosylase SLT domain-containing protein [Neptunicella marina]MBC3766584.1 transglycosylase SLT domain-containing protein [Neptunicella marina]
MKMRHYCVFFIGLMMVLPSSAQQESIFDKIRKKQAAGQTSAIELTPEEQQFKQQYLQELQQYTHAYLQEFAQFKAEYNRELADYRSNLLASWGEVEVSNQQALVSYGEPDVKAVVDFEQQQVVISVLHDANDDVDNVKVRAALKSLSLVHPSDMVPQKNAEPLEQQNSIDLLNVYSGKNISEASLAKMVSDAEASVIQPVITQDEIDKEHLFLNTQANLDSRQLDVIGEQANIDQQKIDAIKAALFNNARQNTHEVDKRRQQIIDERAEDLKKKRITRYKINLHPKSELQRIASVKPDAEKYAKSWKLPVELVIAVIHTESSFNPLAVSNIPAYGLMQIVPYSAGMDVNEFLHKKRAPMQPELLFISPKNIEAGSAYLHLLNSRYLSAIEQDQSRLYCAIAAYNTGVGNVVRAFTQGKQKSLTPDVIRYINQMPPQQIYQRLLNNLPYEETRHYLKKVTERMQHYKNII